MNTLTHKGYGAIYVSNPMDIDTVKEIIKEMDEFEYEYIPDGLIKHFSEYPSVCYTHKFSDLDTDDLTAICWSRGIMVWVFDPKTEFPSSAFKKYDSLINTANKPDNSSKTE